LLSYLLVAGIPRNSTLAAPLLKVVIEPSLSLDDSGTKERLCYEEWDSSSKDKDAFLENFLGRIESTKKSVATSNFKAVDNPYRSARVITLGTGL
jgi:hypothetical protein